MYWNGETERGQPWGHAHVGGEAMPDQPPTLGEVIRRLDTLARSLEELGKDIREDRKDAAATYVRRDLYVAERLADQTVTADLAREITAIQADRRSDAGFRRQVLLGLALAAIGSMTSVMVLVVSLVVR